MPLLGAAISIREGSPARHVKRRVFAASAFAGLYVNLVSFPLLVELLIQVVASVAAMSGLTTGEALSLDEAAKKIAAATAAENG